MRIISLVLEEWFKDHLKLVIEVVFMKSKIIFTIMSVFVVLNTVAVGQQLQGDSWADVQERGSGTIVITYFEEPAFAYENENGELTGVTIDLMKHFQNYVQNSKNVTLDIQYVKENDFGALYSSVQNGSGGVFGLANVTISESRKSEVSFSPPYLTNVALMITHSEMPDIRSMEQIGTHFSDMKAVAYSGTLHEERMGYIKELYHPELEIIRVDSDTEVISKVASGSKYFGYVDIYNYWLATQNDVAIKRQEIGDDVSEEFGIIMPPESDWQPIMDEFFNLGSGGYRTTPLYLRMLVSHLGMEVTGLLEIARRSGSSDGEQTLAETAGR